MWRGGEGQEPVSSAHSQDQTQARWQGPSPLNHVSQRLGWALGQRKADSHTLL